MKKYVLGVALTPDNFVALIKKTKPEWQAGHFNFVGGKIELGEDPHTAMRREFQEETGVDIEEWKYVGKMERPDDFICHIYTVTDARVSNITTTTEEPVMLMKEDYFVTAPDLMISNLKTIHQFIKSQDYNNTGATLNIDYPNR